MNVIGARPDGWWRDRPGAMRRLVEALGEYARESGDAVAVVFDGRAVDMPSGNVEVSFAPGGPNAADDEIAECLRAAADPAAIAVVTSDRDLAGRARATGATVVSARAFRERIGAD